MVTASSISDLSSANTNVILTSDHSSHSMLEGTIKLLKTDKGYGFIKRDGLADLFFHASECGGKYKDIEIGAVVQFKVKQGRRGEEAECITIV